MLHCSAQYSSHCLSTHTDNELHSNGVWQIALHLLCYWWNTHQLQLDLSNWLLHVTTVERSIMITSPLSTTPWYSQRTSKMHKHEKLTKTRWITTTVQSTAYLFCNAQPLEPCKGNREVLLDQSVVLKDDNDVDLKLHLKVAYQQGRTGKQSREDHVQRDGHTTADVTLTNLNVLNFGSVFGVPFGTTTRLNSN